VSSRVEELLKELVQACHQMDAGSLALKGWKGKEGASDMKFILIVCIDPDQAFQLAKAYDRITD
jgi:hypothetical protein